MLCLNHGDDLPWDRIESNLFTLFPTCRLGGANGTLLGVSCLLLFSLFVGCFFFSKGRRGVGGGGGWNRAKYRKMHLKVVFFVGGGEGNWISQLPLQNICEPQKTYLFGHNSKGQILNEGITEK